MGHHAVVYHRLAALRLSHLPSQIFDWIERDLAGVDPASVAAIVTPDYAVLASRLAIAEMVRRRPAARPLLKDEKGKLFLL
jgi:hypothetical protein